MPCQCALRCVRSCIEQCTQVHRDKGATQSLTCYGQCTRSCVPQCAAGSFELVEMGEQVESAASTLQPYVASLQPYVSQPATLCFPGGERRLDAAPLRPARAGVGLILAIGLTLVYRIDLRRKL